ncbi:hypothetical protein JVT61DRAFT_8702 [Boletus reticuloceps]|uniref:Uncharacterized protein n=1 Tax=Boletus reticuloceps TaxID=495285 RepID=A0A8I2YHV8_9AGAM|nr:hypothetical protein JVT61DRAFT_8702 [Boletus reticuloceps]
MVPALDPHNARIPDFTLDRFRAARQPLVDDFGLTHELAAQRLAAMWQAQNNIDREDWDNLQEELAEAARLQQVERRLEEEEQQRALDEEKELTKQEERKKNRNKFLTYNKVPISTAITKLPLPIATRKLKKGDFVELYYFTNKGLAEAEASTRSMDDDALTLTRDEDGQHAFVPVTASKFKDTVIPDKDLTWAEFDEAAPRLIQAMRESSWEEERVQSHLSMWLKLSGHPYRHDPDEYGKRALIVYQDTARRRWHNLLGTPESFDLVPISMEMIKEIRDDLLHKSNKALREEALQASTIPIPLPAPSHPRTLSPTLSPSFPPLFLFFRLHANQPLHTGHYWLHLYRSRFPSSRRTTIGSTPLSTLVTTRAQRHHALFPHSCAYCRQSNNFAQP